MPDYPALGANYRFTLTQTVYVNSVSTLGALADGTAYPYRLQSTPLSVQEGSVYQGILCGHFGYQRIALLYAEDYPGTQSAKLLLDGSVCTFNVLYQASFSPSATSFASLIGAAKASGALVFVLFAEPPAAGRLLEQGHQAGLFNARTQVYGSSAMSTPTTFLTMSPTADIPAIMRGYYGLQFAPHYPLNNTANGRAFIRRWRVQEPTYSTDPKYTSQWVSGTGEGTSNCSDDRSDDGNVRGGGG